jgi:hypothetical protein
MKADDNGVKRRRASGFDIRVGKRIWLKPGWQRERNRKRKTSYAQDAITMQGKRLVTEYFPIAASRLDRLYRGGKQRGDKNSRPPA